MFLLYTTDQTEVYDTGLYNPNDQLAILPAIAPFLGFAYSQGYEFLHDEEHQILLSPEWSDPAIPSQNVHSWYQAGSTAGTLELLFRAPPYLPEVMNPYILNQTKTALATNSTPCASDLIVPGETDGLCQSLTDNSAHPLLDKVDFPVILCSSPGES